MARLSFALLAFASAVAAGRSRICGSSPSIDKIQANEAKFKNLLEDSDARNAFSSKVPSANSSVIQTYFHVIRAGEDLTQGNVPESQINAQMEVLNQDYAATGFSFELGNISYVDNDKWFAEVGPGNSYQQAMKETLRVGDASALNVYLVSFDNTESKGLLGYATFPTDADEALSDDGVVVLYSSLPGGTSVPFNEGRTLSHEAGHWVGLYHTFQGGCEDGDMVTDTPAQATPSSGCSPADTCPDKAGADQFHNFMDYSDDSCMTEFTDGQIERMKQQLETYRGLTARTAKSQPARGATY